MFELLSKKFHSYSSDLIYFLKKNKIEYINLFEIYCDYSKKSCNYINESSNILFIDFAHLTPDGMIFLSNKLHKTYGGF